MLMTIKFPLKMSKRTFVCQLTLLNIDKYSNNLIESSINTNEMFSRVNEKRIYVIDITFGINESIFSGNEQQKVYTVYLHKMQRRNRIPIEHRERIVRAFEDKAEVTC